MAISASTHVHGEVEVGEEANEEVDKQLDKEVADAAGCSPASQLSGTVGQSQPLHTAINPAAVPDLRKPVPTAGAACPQFNLDPI